MFVRSRWAIALAVVALAGMQPEGRAYNYIGCRWPDHPVGRTTLHYNGEGSADVWKAAGQRWGAANSNVSFAEDSVAHTFSASSADYGNAGFDGFIQYTCVGGFFVPRQVRVGLNTFYTNSYPAGMRLAVAGHELGHAAGLAHNDAADCSRRPLMHSTSARWVQCGIDRPTADDTAGTRGLYP